MENTENMENMENMENNNQTSNLTTPENTNNTPEKKKVSKWVWIGGGIAAAIAIFLLVYFLCFYKSPAVQAVERKISNIGTVDLTSETTIGLAEEAYKALTDKEKSQVKNADVLTDARAQYDILFDKKKAADVDERIANIGTVDFTSETKITHARAAYDALTESQKKYVQNLNVLEMAEEDYEVLDVKDAEEKILAIREASSDPDGKLPFAIDAAREAYDSLSPEHKEMVSNYENLEDSEQAYQEYAEKQTAAKIQREKEQRITDRQSYIDACQKVGYQELIDKAGDLKGKKVQFSGVVKEIEDPALFKSGKMVLVIQGGKDTDYISVIDKRTVKEPAFTAGDIITVYGTAAGTTTVESYEEGSGLFGSDLFAKVAESKVLPVVNMTYTDLDDIQSIKDQVTVTEVLDGVEKGIEIASDLTNLIKSIPWQMIK